MPHTTRRTATSATVLFVDDEPLIRELGRVVLEQAGYAVFTAADGVAGVEAFAAHHSRIGVVVLDVLMPRMTGRAAFDRIRALDPTARVILSTGYAGGEDVTSLDGVTAFLNKPYSPADLVAAVRAALADPVR